MMYSVLIQMLKQYLRGSLSMQALEEWTVEQLQAIIDSRDERAIDTANQLDAFFIEMGEGIATEADLQSLIQQLVSAHESEFSVTATESTTQTFNREIGLQPLSRNLIINPAFGVAAVGT